MQRWFLNICVDLSKNLESNITICHLHYNFDDQEFPRYTKVWQFCLRDHRTARLHARTITIRKFPQVAKSITAEQFSSIISRNRGFSALILKHLQYTVGVGTFFHGKPEFRVFGAPNALVSEIGPFMNIMHYVRINVLDLSQFPDIEESHNMPVRCPQKFTIWERAKKQIFLNHKIIFLHTFSIFWISWNFLELLFSFPENYPETIRISQNSGNFLQSGKASAVLHIWIIHEHAAIIKARQFTKRNATIFLDYLC